MVVAAAPMFRMAGAKEAPTKADEKEASNQEATLPPLFVEQDEEQIESEVEDEISATDEIEAEVEPEEIDDVAVEERSDEVQESDSEETLVDEEIVPVVNDSSEDWFHEGAAVAPAKLKRNERRAKKAPLLVRLWNVFTTLFFIGALVLVGALVAAWVFRDAIGAKLEALVNEKIAEQGVFLDYAGWNYNPIRGLVMNEVTLFADEQKATPLVGISDVAVNTDLRELYETRKPEAQDYRISLKDSKLEFYDKGEVVGSFENTSADLDVSTAAVSVESLKTRFAGLQLNLDGEVALAPAEQSKEATEEPAGEVETNSAPAGLPPMDFSFFRELVPMIGISSEGAAPSVTGTFALDAANPNGVTVSGVARGKAFTWRKIPVRSLNAPFEISPAELTFPGFALGYGSGDISGSAVYNVESESIALDNVRSNADLLALASEFDPSLKDKMASINFLDAPKLVVNGLVPTKQVKDSQLKIGYEHWKGLEWVNGEKRLPVSNISGDLSLAGGALSTTNLTANVLGGNVNFRGRGMIFEENIPFSGVLAKINGIPLQNIATYAGADPGKMKGNLFLEYRGSFGKELSSLQGGGEVRLENGHLYSVPVVGPINSILSKVLPIFAGEKGHALTASYIAESGHIVTGDLVVRGDGTKVDVRGNLNLHDQTTEFTAQANLDGPLGVATALVGKALEVQGSGPIADPKIQLKGDIADFAGDSVTAVLGVAGVGTEFVTQVLEGGAGVVGTVTGGATDAVGAVTEGAVDAVEAVAGGTGDAVGAVTGGAVDAVGGVLDGTVGKILEGAQSVGEAPESGLQIGNPVESIGSGLKGILGGGEGN